MRGQLYDQLILNLKLGTSSVGRYKAMLHGVNKFFRMRQGELHVMGQCLVSGLLANTGAERGLREGYG